ncbi:MAG: TIGR03905 family TSCPD domain-containing protein [Oscillospiraceae bacterium]|nr:TIGR03905 family TSCPD domain-containing protein [Oscillospiraceae bacterium]
MIRKYSYKTKGSCASEIELKINEKQTIEEIRFINGCPGNTDGIARLVTGMQAEEVIKKLKGTDCAGKGTSCPDQLSAALECALKSFEG